MKMAIAVETFKHPDKNSDYKVWYLNLSHIGEVVGIGVMTRKELVQNLFSEYKRTGKSGWRAFCKEDEQSRSIEVFDFIAQNTNENTHFGNLPTLAEFQVTLNQLQLNLELRSVAS
ncbi:MAG: hypothetical protein K9K67_05210 [Bacteriovoracaceae bacterium]|nr:hypothetical protein [Bacteriovoracaceae bacterium]